MISPLKIDCFHSLQDRLVWQSNIVLFWQLGFGGSFWVWKLAGNDFELDKSEGKSFKSRQEITNLIEFFFNLLHIYSPNNLNWHFNNKRSKYSFFFEFSFLLRDLLRPEFTFVNLDIYVWYQYSECYREILRKPKKIKTIRQYAIEISYSEYGEQHENNWWWSSTEWIHSINNNISFIKIGLTTLAMRYFAP